MANWVMFQWGPIQFQVFPFNVDNFSHHTGADWAKKEIAGAAMYREWVGEGEEAIVLKGKLFPHFFATHMRRRGQLQPVLSNKASIDPETGKLREHTGGHPSFGGLFHLDVLDNMRRLGQAHILMRGDGWHYGWYIIEVLNRGHSFLAADGVGQQIEFEAQFQRVPIPNDPADNTNQLWSSGAITSGA
jgi:phage tail protein